MAGTVELKVTATGGYTRTNVGNLTDAEQARVLTAIKAAAATEANPTPTNNEAVDFLWAQFKQFLLNMVQAQERATASNSSVNSIAKVAIT